MSKPQIKVGDSVFPKWSQFLPAFTVCGHVGIMLTIRDHLGNTQQLHQDDVVMRDDAVQYTQLGYHVF